MGNKILHQFANDSEMLQAILALLSPADYQTAVKEIERYKLMTLFNFLQEKRQQLKDVEAAHDYPSLKTQVIQQELCVEIESLTQLLLHSKNLEAFRQVFLASCERRAIQNAGTCLSFFAMPDGECNQLYWQIAERLFEPETMGDMLGILAPDVTTLVTYEVVSDASQGSLREQAKNPVFHFQAKNLACLEQPHSRAALSELAVSGNQLFEVANLVEFSFATHEKFFDALQKQYPQLAEALYQHNEAFKKLRQNLLAVSKGQSPREVIKEFIQQLLRGGQTLTGEDYASLGAQEATTDFFVYLESLPVPLKQDLLLLKNEEGRSLNDVCEHLREENCVEQASEYLQGILNNEANATILDTKPHLSPEQLQVIRQLYGRTHELPAVNGNSSTTLPTYYLEENLKQLVIDDEQAYLNLITAFPPSYYLLLLKHAQITCEPALPVELGEMIVNGVFNREQLAALNQAIFVNMERLGGFSQSLQFALNYSNYELVKLILTSLSPQQRIAWLTRKDENGYTFLRTLIGFPERLTTVLTSLPESERSIIISEKNSIGYNALHDAIFYPETLKAILTSLPESARLAAVNEKNSGGDSLLHLAAVTLESLKVILTSLPESERLAAINEKDRHGNSILHLAANSPEFLEVILTSLPAIHRWDAIKEENGKHLNPFHRIIKKTDTLTMVFGLLHESHRLAAIKANNLLMGTIYSPETFLTLLCLVPEPKRLAALKDAKGNLILPHSYISSTSYSYGYSLIPILTLLPETDRLDFVTERGDGTQNLLERMTSNQGFQAVLNLLPEIVPLNNPAYSAKKNEQIAMLYSNINQLRSYGQKLYAQANDIDAEIEGKKAICLALSLSHFANKFIHAQSNDERLSAQSAFEKELQQGMLDMHHRALWKPVIANIIIAATGLGLLAIAVKAYLTGSAFFMQTERHKKADEIASNFIALQETEEETHQASP